MCIVFVSLSMANVTGVTGVTVGTGVTGGMGVTGLTLPLLQMIIRSGRPLVNNHPFFYIYFNP